MHILSFRSANDTVAAMAALSPPPGILPNLDHPDDVLSTINLLIQVLTVAIVTPFLLARLYAKLVIAPPFLVDDWICLLAYVLFLCYVATGCAMWSFGGGHHAWDLPRGTYESFLKVRSIHLLSA